jgi:uncharacterized protein (DUF488 family)
MTSSNATRDGLYTIGHSNLDLGDFLAVLVHHGVKTLCDVRSRPGSFRFPQFNREPLEAAASLVKIQYQFLGESLGGRPEDPRAYHSDGQVDYFARRKSPDFSAGVDRLLGFYRSAGTALMCAEEDPLQCHRFLMICPALVERGVLAVHIRRNGILESQRDAEDRLLDLHGGAAFTSGALFVTERGPALEDALRCQAKEFAFRTSPEAIEYF